MKRHPFEDFAFVYTCSKLGLDPALMRRYVDGDAPIDAGTAVALSRLPDGPPASSWAVVSGEAVLTARPLPRKAPMSTSHDTHGAAHERRIDAVTRAAHAKSWHPFLAWLGDESVRNWAQRHQLKRARVQHWIQGRRGIPHAWAQRIAEESGGQVPMTSWARIRPVTA